jgi:CoA-transferase family III
METIETRLAKDLWTALGGPATALNALEFSGAPGGLPSRFQVSAFANSTIGVATLAAAELWARRRGEKVRRVTVERGVASAAFRCERLLTPIGWSLPAMWDPMTADYEAADGWIRLHTNYSCHRDAALRILGAAADKSQVADAVKSWRAEELESAVVDAGGCAAALRSRGAWQQHAQGIALGNESICIWDGRRSPRPARAEPDSPLGGIRVLDLTRVIAGPIGTRYLAAFGADVLRLDPPGFQEVPVLLPTTTRGKRCAAIDLKNPAQRSTWERLVTQADILVHGYRPGAMEALGYSTNRLRELNPALAIVRCDAYGWSGPWAARRGFDSLVQMSSGIAHPGSDGRPTPLPGQALDHGTGYLIAAAACRALSDGYACARLSLARTARLLLELGTDGDAHALERSDVDECMERTDSEWGPLRDVRCPGRIEGYDVRWRHAAGSLARHEPRWSD